MVKRGSEFGGQDGRIQPLPHPLSTAESSRLMRAIDPDPETVDTGPKVTTIDEQRVVDAGARGVGPVDAAGDLT